MKKVTFVVHKLHLFKSRSHKFLLNLLRKNFEVRLIQYQQDKENLINKINSINSDIVVFFQWMPLNPYTLATIKCRQIVYVPMRDGVRYGIWWIKFMFNKLKVLSFCKETYIYLEKIGLLTEYFKFYPKPINISKKDYSKKIVLFWQRKKKIDWSLVKKILGDQKIYRTYLKFDSSSFAMPDKKDMTRYNIQILEKWISKRKFMQIMNEATIFFAPREYEGIGMTFLTAMAYGNCVISPNKPTASEYITNNENGILYDLNNVKKIDLKNYESIGRNARKSIELGYGLWNESESELIRFLDKPIYMHEFLFRPFRQIMGAFIVLFDSCYQYAESSREKVVIEE